MRIFLLTRMRQRICLVEIQKQLKKRQWGEVIRLEVEDKMDPRLLDILKMEFQVHGDDIFFINGPLDLTMLMKVYGIDGYDAVQGTEIQTGSSAGISE